MKPSPCKGCTDRYLACHDHCEGYQSWRKEQDEINLKKRRGQEFAGYISEQFHKCLKMGGNKRR